MPKYDIILHLDPTSMTCGSCSRAIKSTLLDFLQENQLPNLDNVATNYTNKTASISLDLTNDTSADELIRLMKTKLEETGFLVINSNIIPVDGPFDRALNTDQTAENNDSTSLTLLKSLLPLSAGVGIMAIDYVGLVASIQNPWQLLLRIGIGAIGTSVTLLSGHQYFRQSWRFLKAFNFSESMDHLISLSCFSAMGASFLSLCNVPYFNDAPPCAYFSDPLIVLGILGMSHAIRDHFYHKINRELSDLNTQHRTVPNTAHFVGSLSDENSCETRLVSQIQRGSIIAIYPGEIVPIDGILTEPDQKAAYEVSSIKEYYFGQLGEKNKQFGELIYASSRNVSKHTIFLSTICAAENNQIALALQSITRSNQQANPFLATVSKWFLPSVLMTALGSGVYWSLSKSFNVAIQHFLSVCFSACPCGMGFIDILPGIYKKLAFDQNILLRNLRGLQLSSMTAICIDKCGTATDDCFQFDSIYLGEENSSMPVSLTYLSYARTLQQQIDPLKRNAIAKALIQTVDDYDLTEYHCDKFYLNQENDSRGGIADIDGKTICIGDKRLIQNYCEQAIPEEWLRKAHSIESNDKRILYFAINKRVCALFILRIKDNVKQTLRPQTVETIATWLQAKRKVYLLTGDTQQRANQFILKLKQEYSRMSRIGIMSEESRLLSAEPDILNAIKVQAEMNPMQKTDFVLGLQRAGERVVMIGDELNDEPVLSQADIGVAIGPDAYASARADVILNQSLQSMVVLNKLSSDYQSANRSSVTISFASNALGLSFAAGLFYSLIGDLEPKYFGMWMAISSLLVVLNIFGSQKISKKKLTTPFWSAIQTPPIPTTEDWLVEPHPYYINSSP